MFYHNLNVMHIEKNVFENIFNMVMDMKGKTNDNIKV
jgi:predicted amino acid-binding ACT domain protein